MNANKWTTSLRSSQKLVSQIPSVDGSSVITENDTEPREECSAKRLLRRLAGNLFRYRSFSLFLKDVMELVLMMITTKPYNIAHYVASVWRANVNSI